MSSTDIENAGIAATEVRDSDERYHFKLSEILRLRSLPFLLVVDRDGGLEWSSFAEGTSFSNDQGSVLDKALAESRRLLVAEAGASASWDHVIVEKPDERSSLVMLGDKCYSIRLFPLHSVPAGDEIERYAVVVEPVVKPFADGVAFERVKATWHLSKREVDVIRELMSGGTDKAIAHVLEVSVETVRAYLKSVRAKLGVGTRTAVVHKIHEMNSVWHREDISSRVM